LTIPPTPELKVGVGMAGDGVAGDTRSLVVLGAEGADCLIVEDTARPTLTSPSSAPLLKAFVGHLKAPPWASTIDSFSLMDLAPSKWLRALQHATQLSSCDEPPAGNAEDLAWATRCSTEASALLRVSPQKKQRPPCAKSSRSRCVAILCALVLADKHTSRQGSSQTRWRHVSVVAALL